MVAPDAWSLRKRNGRGQSAKLPWQGTEPARWHRVHTGTVLRPDHCRQTAGGRTVVARYGYVLPRQRSSARLQHLQGEAFQRGAGG
jgi:hypothetical protein